MADKDEAQHRASDQVDRQVQQQQRTTELVEGLDEDNQDTVENSDQALSAMTAPPQDDAQVQSMTDDQDGAPS